MTLLDWVPALTTTSLVAVGLWLARNLIRTRLTKSVEYEFNTKLEALKTDLRKAEEQFKADIRAKEAEMAALRGGVLNAMSTRQVALDQRRLEAVDQLWSAVNSLAPAKGISAQMALIKFEAAAAETGKNPNARQVFQVMGSGFDIKKIDLAGAHRARPFLTPMAWALFTAYQAIVMQAAVKLELLKSGIGKADFVDQAATANLVKLALPHYAAYVDEHGDAGYHYLLDELEQRLLEELQRMVAGVDSDKANVERAAEIVKLSGELLDTAMKEDEALADELRSKSTSGNIG